MMSLFDAKDGQEGFIADIQVRIRKNYGADPNLIAGILDWRMIEDLDNMTIDEFATFESNIVSLFCDNKKESGRIPFFFLCDPRTRFQ